MLEIILCIYSDKYVDNKKDICYNYFTKSQMLKTITHKPFRHNVACLNIFTKGLFVLFVLKKYIKVLINLYIFKLL